MNADTTTPERDYTLIQRFFDFDLSPKELEDFDQKVSTDATFAKRVHIYRQSEQFIEQQFPPLKEVQQPQQRNRSTRTALAIGILLLIGGLIALFFLLQPSPGEVADKAWYATEKLLFDDTLRSIQDDSTTDNTISTLLSEASDALNAGDYEEALSILTPIPTPAAGIVHVLRGQAQYELGAYPDAINNFNLALDSPNTADKDIVTWLLALTYLKTENVEAAKTLLEQIVAADLPKAEAAQEILQQI